MRITISHNKPKAEVIRSVDRSFDDLFRGSAVVPLQIVNERRIWNGNTLTFSFDAKFGLLSAPIKGFIEVTDKDLTIDADLGLLEKLFPAKQARAVIEGRIRGLLT
ncbi:MAG: polyhydroxyalkanoic acid system family protein [Acidobacteriota bacterium]|nr:polyhydroxyalkanoic acid system family protein [Acidobacteriota bacterium]